jgi:hypothetical protein
MAGIFSRFIFNNAIFNTDGGDVIPDGGAAGFDYTNYRKHLEELGRIERERQVKKYKRKIKRVIKLARKAPPEIKAAIEQIELVPSIDLQAWALEIERRIAELIALIILLEQQEKDKLLKAQIEEENKLILLLLA